MDWSSALTGFRRDQQRESPPQTSDGDGSNWVTHQWSQYGIRLSSNGFRPAKLCATQVASGRTPVDCPSASVNGRWSGE